MQLERQMEYAIGLADPEFHGEGEDYSKLASLVNEIAQLRERGAVANPDLDGQVYAAIKAAYRANGVFRHALEWLPRAKQLVSEM
jgi:hypothetical protein